MCRNNMQLRHRKHGLFSKMKIVLSVTVGRAARSPGAVFTVISDTPGQ